MSEVLKLANRKDCIGGCPYCGFQIYIYDFIQRCHKCKRPRDISVENIETKIKKRIHGVIYLYDFLSDNKIIIFFTSSAKFENLYLYNIELDKIIWAKRIHDDISSGDIYLQRVISLGNRIIIIISYSQATKHSAFLESYNIHSGNLIAQIKMAGKLTNVIKCNKNIIAGCRDGFIYSFDKNLNLINNFCIKEPHKEYDSPWSTPSPINIITNDREDYIAFSSEAILFLFDSEINFIWSKNISKGYFDYIVKFPFMIGNYKFQKEKYSLAYKELELNPDSTKQQIKEAFRNKALQYHPDRHNEKNKKIAGDKFTRIVNAYEFLNNVDKNELENELSSMGFYSNITIKVSVADLTMISKIDFLIRTDTNKLHIKIETVQGKELLFNLEGKILKESKVSSQEFVIIPET